jgi:hypothetical protein
METELEPQKPAERLPAIADDVATGVDVQCPLCDYDLRGQVEPQCPECGYRFEWSDLTDPAKKLHPYLFEHHPRRNLSSFARTMVGGLRPRRFWSSLKPTQPSRPRRLVLYWLISSLLLPTGYVAVFARTTVTFLDEHEQNRRRQLQAVNTHFATYGSEPTPGSLAADVADAGGVQAWVDRFWPPTNRPAAYVRYVYEVFYAHTARQHIEAITLLFAWPWLTLATLMIFRASMRRAKVNAVHVLRCALYSCDASLWLGLVALLAVPPLVHWLDLGRYIGFRDAAVSAPLFAAFTTWRLAAAYRHYLQFHRPFSTAAAAQAIVLLVAWVYLYTKDFWW